jgi:hypothetical protein
VVERTDGCNFLACSCGQNFCYQCGDKLDHEGYPFEPEKERCTCGSFSR